MTLPPRLIRAQAAGLKWVVVGDENYGEGSSREHAGELPRLILFLVLECLMAGA